MGQAACPAFTDQAAARSHAFALGLRVPNVPGLPPKPTHVRKFSSGPRSRAAEFRPPPHGFVAYPSVLPPGPLAVSWALSLSVEAISWLCSCPRSLAVSIAL
jgi:hypothetical protein